MRVLTTTSNAISLYCTTTKEVEDENEVEKRKQSNIVKSRTMCRLLSFCTHHTR